VGETLYAALNAIAVVGPAWLKALAPPIWFERYQQRFCDYRLPKEDRQRQVLAEIMGADGYFLLEAIYAATPPTWLREMPQVRLLRQVWLQNYYQDEERVAWRPAGQSAPAGQMIASPYDPDTRYSAKRGETWIGYKVHLTETCDPDAPHLITHVETTPATEQDSEVVERLHDDLARSQLLPREHLVDTSYSSGELLCTSQDHYGIDLVCPLRPDNSWQAQAQKGFSLYDFHVDWEAHQVTCPMGKTSTHWKAGTGPRGKPTIQVPFTRVTCADCPARALCTHSKTSGRGLTLPPTQAHHEQLHAARARQQTPEFRQRYAARSGIEGTLSQAVYTLGMRQARYRGLIKTRLQQHCTAAAINLSCIVAWLMGYTYRPARLPAFAALSASF